MEKMSLPSVWPLLGTVERAFKHYYGADEVTFPPPGHMLEVSYYTEMKQEFLGKCERENHDILYLAWLRELQAVQGDIAEVDKIKRAAQVIPCRFNCRASENDKLCHAYQHKEDEEKNAEILGHSFLSRGREIVGLQDTHDPHPEASHSPPSSCMSLYTHDPSPCH